MNVSYNQFAMGHSNQSIYRPSAATTTSATSPVLRTVYASLWGFLHRRSSSYGNMLARKINKYILKTIQKDLSFKIFGFFAGDSANVWISMHAHMFIAVHANCYSKHLFDYGNHTRYSCLHCQQMQTTCIQACMPICQPACIQAMEVGVRE